MLGQEGLGSSYLFGTVVAAIIGAIATVSAAYYSRHTARAVKRHRTETEEVTSSLLMTINELNRQFQHCKENLELTMRDCRRLEREVAELKGKGRGRGKSGRP